MAFVYFLALLGLSTTCYRVYKCIEILEFDTKPGIKKTILRIIGTILMLPALPYTFIFVSLEMVEFKRHQKRHREELQLVQFISSLSDWPSKEECEIYGLTPISDSTKEAFTFREYRQKIYEDLGMY